MPIRGPLAHLDLTVSDLARSTAFYERVLGHLGFRRRPGGDPNWVVAFAGAGFDIALQAARRDAPHDRYTPGLHHVAFHAESRADVDATHALLREMGATILDPPAEYSGPAYSPGYYAVFFADPDGLKLEVLHEPRANP